MKNNGRPKYCVECGAVAFYHCKYCGEPLCDACKPLCEVCQEHLEDKENNVDDTIQTTSMDIQ